MEAAQGEGRRGGGAGRGSGGDLGKRRTGEETALAYQVSGLGNALEEFRAMNQHCE
jgi:sulfopyruvate decarboxylase TPP-binding subunit